MTALAIASEAAVVHVIVVMTAGTGSGQAYLALHRLAMAGEAVDSFVPAIQLEACAFVVIEIPRLPVARVVALAAVRAEIEFVLVFFLVAGDAVAFRVLVGRGQVAFLALDLGVFAEQREARQAVVE